ncbi:chloramphenicol-sensitive protein RarD [Sphingobacterium alimentarium]|jgi:chloramphenicol-sensitive protein RarD|uniref:Chloramphenicol-sensitive protein RarD n=1 Tax=Sphingobacterium alimentarium TaxID=797292 RepID=A0A4R3W1H3_9SPHI|nr:EamA family transporter [Sphingobacterium alimentarium]TCV20424.1 chloramphenicol-sensitive protein RarD [Sphingobacterium alimentarium]
MQLKYYAAALFSFVVWGMFSLVLKPLSDYAALDILTYRVAFAAIIIAIVSLTVRYKVTKANLSYIRSLTLPARNKIIGTTIFSAIMLAVNWYLYIYVMNTVSVNATSLAYLICPILTTVLAGIFLKERLNTGQWVAVGMSILSCIMLSYGHFMDMLYSVIIALSYAIYLVLQKANTQLDRFFTLTLHILISAILLIPMGLSSSSEVMHSDLFFQYVLLIAVLFTIIPLFLNMYALKGLDSSVVGVLLYINPIIAFLLAVFYFNENITSLQGIAYGLIFVAVVVFNISYLKK